MRRVIWLVLVAFVAAATVIAQDAPKKKKGGFWNKVKKGVESATGIDVSKETLFVYPEMGQWKMELKSAEGDQATTGQTGVHWHIRPSCSRPFEASARSSFGLEAFFTDHCQHPGVGTRSASVCRRFPFGIYSV